MNTIHHPVAAFYCRHASPHARLTDSCGQAETDTTRPNVKSVTDYDYCVRRSLERNERDPDTLYRRLVTVEYRWLEC